MSDPQVHTAGQRERAVALQESCALLGDGGLLPWQIVRMFAQKPWKLMQCAGGQRGAVARAREGGQPGGASCASWKRSSELGPEGKAAAEPEG